MKILYKTQGTCSNHIEVEVEDGRVKDLNFWGGCNGNLKGICSLGKGMKTDDVLARLEGIRCGHRGTWSRDQLWKAIGQLTGQQGE